MSPELSDTCNLLVSDDATTTDVLVQNLRPTSFLSLSLSLSAFISKSMHKQSLSPCHCAGMFIPLVLVKKYFEYLCTKVEVN